MAAPAIRIDRVIRVTFWNHQTVSVLVQDGRLLIIRTGVLAAAATGSVFNEATITIVCRILGGEPPKSLEEYAAGDTSERGVAAGGNWLERTLTRGADKATQKREAEITRDKASSLATGWMSANLPLGDIAGAAVSETLTQRREGLVPQLQLKTKGDTITLRFPQTPMTVVEALAAVLRQGSQAVA